MAGFKVHLSVCVSIDCTCNDGNAAYIVYVTSLAIQLKTHRHIQWAHMGVCNGETDFALTNYMA